MGQCDAAAHDGRFDARDIDGGHRDRPTRGRRNPARTAEGGGEHDPRLCDEPPGIFAVDPDGRLTAATGPAEHWLGIGKVSLVTAVKAAAAAIRSNPNWAGASSRLMLGDG